MNVYRMYIENGGRAGFWVQHRSWRNVCAQVMKVEHDTGVCLEYFDVRSGREVVPMPSEDGGYARIAEPPWCHADSNGSKSTLTRGGDDQ